MATSQQSMTYSQLLADLPSYMERQDVAFMSKLQRFISLGENRLATDMKQQGFLAVVSGTLPLSAVMPKPAFWRETVSFSVTVDGETVPVRLRNLEYVKAYANGEAASVPRFYADYNATHFYLGPASAVAYQFELCYYARLQPLTEENQSNWMSLNTPQALLYACLLEASLWVKEQSKIATWTAQYTGAKEAILAENQERLVDRREDVRRG